MHRAGKLTRWEVSRSVRRLHWYERWAFVIAMGLVPFAPAIRTPSLDGWFHPFSLLLIMAAGYGKVTTTMQLSRLEHTGMRLGALAASLFALWLVLALLLQLEVSLFLQLSFWIRIVSSVLWIVGAACLAAGSFENHY